MPVTIKSDASKPNIALKFTVADDGAVEVEIDSVNGDRVAAPCVCRFEQTADGKLFINTGWGEGINGSVVDCDPDTATIRVDS